MKFDKRTHKAIIETLEGDEVEAYIDFLKAELWRHKVAIDEAESYHFSIATTYLRARNRLWASAIERHEEDIRQIDENIKQAKMLKV